jgi:hypothetical protein
MTGSATARGGIASGQLFLTPDRYSYFRAFTFQEWWTIMKIDGTPCHSRVRNGRYGMRSAFLLSVVSVVVLGLFGLVRSTPQETDTKQPDEKMSDEESTLFVG